MPQRQVAGSNNQELHIARSTYDKEHRNNGSGVFYISKIRKVIYYYATKRKKHLPEKGRTLGRKVHQGKKRRPEKLYMDMSTLLPMRKQRKRETKQQMEWIRKS